MITTKIEATDSAGQNRKVLELLRAAGMLRHRELLGHGIAPTTLARLERAGTIVRFARGLYGLPDSAIHLHHDLAEAAKQVPAGVICLLSALAFHDLTDQIPSKIWMAIGSKDWKPKIAYPSIRIARFPDKLLREEVERHRIENVEVSIFGPVKTLVDAFRYRHKIGSSVVLQALRTGLQLKRLSPASISKRAITDGVWPAMQPYLETLTLDH